MEMPMKLAAGVFLGNEIATHEMLA